MTVPDDEWCKMGHYPFPVAYFCTREKCCYGSLAAMVLTLGEKKVNATSNQLCLLFLCITCMYLAVWSHALLAVPSKRCPAPDPFSGRADVKAPHPDLPTGGSQERLVRMRWWSCAFQRCTSCWKKIWFLGLNSVEIIPSVSAACGGLLPNKWFGNNDSFHKYIFP